VEFNGPAIKCPSCQGKGTASGLLTLSCIRCAGIGVIEKDVEDKDAADIIGGRLGEITKRLRWTRKKTEKRIREVEKRFKPINPFIKELKKEIQWFEKLGNKIKRGWKSLWED